MIDLSLLAKEKPNKFTKPEPQVRKILNPSEIMDILFGTNVKVQNGKEFKAAGVCDMLDYHTKILENYQNIYLAIARSLKISPKKLVEMTNDVEANQAFQKELRELELKKIEEKK